MGRAHNDSITYRGKLNLCHQQLNTTSDAYQPTQLRCCSSRDSVPMSNLKNLPKILQSKF